jgi:hypothetical protein
VNDEAKRAYDCDCGNSVDVRPTLMLHVPAPLAAAHADAQFLAPSMVHADFVLADARFLALMLFL